MIVEAGARAAPEAPQGTASWRNVVLLLALLLTVLALYAVGVLLPFYVNDLHRLPLRELASGAHDPEDLWPQSAWAAPVQVAGLLAVGFGPLVTLTGAAVAGAWLVSLWRRPAVGRAGRSLALVAVGAGSVAALLFQLSDTGTVLMDWRLD